MSIIAKIFERPAAESGKDSTRFFPAHTVLVGFCSLCVAGCAVTGGPKGNAGGFSKSIGPVYEHRVTAEGEELLAVRPLLARSHRANGKESRTEVLWPLYTSRMQSGQLNWRLGVWFGSNYDVDRPDSISRVWILPLWFQGSDDKGETYRALFPLAGKISGILGMDRFSFFLFPLYETHEINGIVTKSWLWPIISVSRGEKKDIRRAGVFPFYGYSRRGEEWKAQYVLWPFWSHGSYTGDEQGSAWILFPLYGKIETSRQRGWYVLPPFFSGLKSGGDSRYHLPWPFVQRMDGRVEKRYYWPLFGTRKAPGYETAFVAWPLWRTARIDSGMLRTRSRRLLPFWHQVRVYDKQDESIEESYNQVWPLWVRMKKGSNTLTRVVDLWPGRNRAAVDRNWSPWWTLYQRATSPSASSWRALFGLISGSSRAEGTRRGRIWPLLSWKTDDVEETKREWNLLGGLVGYKSRRAGNDHLRLGYFFRIPVGKASEQPAGSASAGRAGDRIPEATETK